MGDRALTKKNTVSRGMYNFFDLRISKIVPGLKDVDLNASDVLSLRTHCANCYRCIGPAISDSLKFFDMSALADGLVPLRVCSECEVVKSLEVQDISSSAKKLKNSIANVFMVDVAVTAYKKCEIDRASKIISVGILTVYLSDYVDDPIKIDASAGVKMLGRSILEYCELVGLKLARVDKIILNESRDVEIAQWLIKHKSLLIRRGVIYVNKVN